MLRDDVQLISVDDHVIEPSHVFVDHIDPRFRDRAPRIIERDDAEGWLWEDRFYPLTFQGNSKTRQVPPGEGGPRRRSVRAALRRHDPGRVRRARARPVNGRRRRVGGTAVPDVSPIRGNAVPRSRGQRPRARHGASVERLDDRRVVRGVPRSLHPADAHPAVGRAGCRRRDRAVRRQGCASGARSSRTHTRSVPSFPTGHWRPVFDACNETGLPLSMHIGTSSGLLQPSPETNTVGRYRAVRRQLDERARAT